MCCCLDFKDCITIAGLVVSVILLLLALLQYRKAEKQKRAEHFFNLRKKYNDNEAFQQIREIIDSPDNSSIVGKEIKLDDKRAFLGFYEEIAIMVNSKLI